MPSNKHRFSYFARQVLDLAQEEAERLHHNVIDCEHLLVGIIRENHGLGSRVLRDLGVDVARIRALVGELNPSKDLKGSNVPELSPVIKQVLEVAVDEALQSGHHYINTEHLLLALVRQTDNVAMEALKRLGVTAEAIRKRIYEILNAHYYTPPRPSPVQLEFEQMFRASQKPIKRLNADTFDGLKNVLMKILDMIADGKLPAAQGIELFNALTPDLKLVPIQQAELISQLFERKSIQDYTVRLNEIDANGVKQPNETILPLTVVLNEMNRFLAMTLNEPDKPLVYQLGDSSLEVRIERNEFKDAQQ